MYRHGTFLLLLLGSFLATGKCSSLSESHAAAKPPHRSEYVLNPKFKITSRKQIRKYDLVVTNTTASPDGLWRSVLAINGQMPGPLLEANEGDDMVITVVNRLASPLTIHWHGLYQNGTNWEDGISAVAQCPIPPGGTYTYTFALDRQYGTFWYHAHYSNLKGDGLVGPLIIHSPRDPLRRGIDFDQEIVMLLQDWYHPAAEIIGPQLLSSSGYKNSIFAPGANSALVNGVGEWNCSFATTNQRCRRNSPPEFTLKAGTKTRFRYINAGSHAMFFISADEHTLNVTEADSTPVHGPTAIHRVAFHNGQRYSVIVNIGLHEVGSSFYMRAQMDPNCWGWVPTDLQNDALAIVRVVGHDGKLHKSQYQRPTTRDWKDRMDQDCMDLDPSLLSPIEKIEVPKTVTGSGTFLANFGFQPLNLIPPTPPKASPASGSKPSRRQVDLASQRTPPQHGKNQTSPSITFNAANPAIPGGTAGRFFVNNITSVSNENMSILQTLNSGGVVNGTALVTFPNLAWYDLYLVNNDVALIHPFHLHGPDMHLVAFGKGRPTLENLRNLTYHTANPLRRDTVAIDSGSFVVIRILADLPGVWAMHCHINWHLAGGFLGALVIQPEKIRSFHIPEKSKALCRGP